MMEIILNLLLVIPVTFFVLSWIQRESKKREARILESLGNITVVAIEIGLLIVRITNGESYRFQLVLAYAWLIRIAYEGVSQKD